MQVHVYPYDLIFKQASGTSRGVLHKKQTYFLRLNRDNEPPILVECPIFRGLSIEDAPDYEQQLQKACVLISKQTPIDQVINIYKAYPSIQFGLEQLALRLSRMDDLIFDSDFTLKNKGILINGLVWMGPVDFMQKQIKEKINAGYSCIKLKIGALDFEQEYELLKKLRGEHPDLEIRVDANGAYNFRQVFHVLEKLGGLNIHSIEQPIAPKNKEHMREICAKSPIPIALDESLIGFFDLKEKKAFLSYIKPHALVLKPALLGGFKGSQEWIDLAKNMNISWWITSALESNLGLNAIAQWVGTLSTEHIHGLGTGNLFTNNLPSKLSINQGKLHYNTHEK